MATVLLSSPPDAFLQSIGLDLGTLAWRSVDPAAPVLLTKTSPLASCHLPGVPRGHNTGSHAIRSLRMSRGHDGPETPNHSLYRDATDSQ